MTGSLCRYHKSKSISLKASKKLKQLLFRIFFVLFVLRVQKKNPFNFFPWNVEKENAMEYIESVYFYFMITSYFHSFPCTFHRVNVKMCAVTDWNIKSWLHTGSNAKAINPSSRRDVVFFIAMHIFTSVIQSYSLFFTLLFHNIKSRSEESITSSKMFMPHNHAEKIFHLNAVQFGLGQVSTLNVANKKWLIVDCFSYSMYRMKYGKTAEVMSKVYVWRQVNVDYSITAWIV